MSGKTVIVGLGNPGREYRAHRHNVGYMVVDRLALAHGLAFSRVQHEALIASGRIEERDVILAKPQTFMNASGRAVSRIVRYYKISLECLLIVYDDLDLPLGTLRFRDAGGAGGHKGVDSVVHELASQSFPRLRLGIGRPPGQMDPADYVLQPFRDDEKPLLDQVSGGAMAGIHTFLTEGIVLAMSRHNGPVTGGGQGNGVV
jgi:PTH1 family peptidyl-tRNA hydrolase